MSEAVMPPVHPGGALLGRSCTASALSAPIRALRLAAYPGTSERFWLNLPRLVMLARHHRMRIG